MFGAVSRRFGVIFGRFGVFWGGFGCFQGPPYTPLLYSRIGVYMGIQFFLFLLQNIDCGYSLEPPR